MTYSSLTPVQTLWQAKWTLKMNTGGKVSMEKSWNFSCLSILWFSFGLVMFLQQIGFNRWEIIEKCPRFIFEQNCPFLQKGKSKFNKSFRNGFLGIKNIKLHVFTKEKYSKMCQKGWKCQFWHTAAAILDSSIFRRGHPGFRTFFNFFFENGIKRYQATNLSRVHDDLKLCPKNNPL